MSDLKWRTPTISDYDILKKVTFESDVINCTDSYTNIILYHEKYKTEICQIDEIVLRKYHALRSTQKDISEKSALYGFPLGNGDKKQAIEFIFDDAQKNGLNVAFPFLTENEKNFLANEFPNKFNFIERRDDADYLYLTKNLANLPGRKFHKKKNHIAQFLKKHPSTEYRMMTKENAKDAASVEKQWSNAHENNLDKSVQQESHIIDMAIKNFDTLNLCGGILYVENKPIAMTMGAAMSEKIMDVYFEKVIPEFDRDGGYAVINNFFAKSVTQFEYLNREEDLGIEGLRQAKLSYYPDIILTKWSAV